MTETEHAQWIRQFWKDKLDEIKGADKTESEEISDRNMKMWEGIFKVERSDKA